MSAREALWPDIGSLALLLAPLPGSDACGPSLRYDPVMVQIRSAREADDPSLPMGDWERPLKRADWPAVQTLCVELLAFRSKDLQAAAWLLEASSRLQQAQGLNTGILLLCGLVEQHWQQLHPRIDDDGDSDARVAPLTWLNEALPLTLRLQLSLLPLPGRKPAQLMLDDWEQLARAGSAGPRADPPHKAGEDGLPARDELLQLAGQPAALAHLHALREQLQHCVVNWRRLNVLVDERLGRDAPSLGRVADALARLQRAVTQLIDGRVPGPGSGSVLREPVGPDTGLGSGLAEAVSASVRQSPSADEPSPMVASPQPADTPAPASSGLALVDSLAAACAPPASGQPPSTGLALTSREAAYRTLQAVADYLQAIEPHSPTPYLVRRAISWGAMPLPQLMQEVLREEGDLNRLFAVLGLPQPTR